MKKIAICGCSHMSPDLNNIGTHFSEIIAKHYNAELLILSRGGISNNAICLQIEQAIALNVDFIIIGLAFPDRVDIPIEQERKSILEYLSSYMNLFKRRGQKEIKEYNRKNLLSNIDYKKYSTPSSKNSFLNNKPVLISDSINNLIFKEDNPCYYYKLNDKTINSLKDYATYLYDYKFKQQIDCWVINNILRKLVYETKINFLLFPYPIFTKEFAEEIKWLDKKYIANVYGPYNVKEDETGPNDYHTSEKLQQSIASELIKFIDERF